VNTTAQAIAFLKQKRDTNATYPSLCMRLAREARGFTYGIYPSALSCMLATPKKYRVTDPKKVKVGMVGFFVDPDDANPFEHIATCVGIDKRGLPIWGGNVAGGLVRFVSHEFFERNWGDKFNFAASSLGTHVIPDLQDTGKPEVQKGKRLKKIIRELEKVERAQRKLGRNHIANRVAEDIKSLKATLKKIQKR
jgi:hypothetical protein